MKFKKLILCTIITANAFALDYYSQLFYEANGALGENTDNIPTESIQESDKETITHKTNKIKDFFIKYKNPIFIASNITAIGGCIYGFIKNRALKKDSNDLAQLKENIKNKKDKLDNIANVEQFISNILKKYEQFRYINKSELSEEEINNLYSLTKNYALPAFISELYQNINTATKYFAQLKTLTTAGSYKKFIAQIDHLLSKEAEIIRCLDILYKNLTKYQNYFAFIAITSELLDKYNYEISNSKLNEHAIKAINNQFPYLAFKEKLASDIKNITDARSKVTERHFKQAVLAEQILHDLNRVLQLVLNNHNYKKELIDKPQSEAMKARLLEEENIRKQLEVKNSELTVESKKADNNRLNLQLEIEKHRSNTIINETIAKKERELADRMRIAQEKIIKLEGIVNSNNNNKSEINKLKDLVRRLRDALAAAHYGQQSAPSFDE